MESTQKEIYFNTGTGKHTPAMPSRARDVIEIGGGRDNDALTAVDAAIRKTNIQPQKLGKRA